MRGRVERGVYSLGERCDERRSARALLLPMLAGALHDPDAGVRRDALWAVRRGGEAARQYADLLADLAAGYPAVAGDEAVTGEYMAAQTLARLADPRWVAPVCQAVAAGHRPVHLVDGARFSTDVLDEVRRGLAARPVTANILSYALVEWGEQASAAAPELAAAVPVADPIVASALLALGHDTPDATALLRDRVESLGSLGAAVAIHRVTGDAVPILDLLRAVLSGGRSRFVADAVSMSALSELGQILTPLMLTAATHLTGVAARTYGQRDVQMLAARVVAAAGDPEFVLPTVSAVLAGGGRSARVAADLIADLGRSRPSLVEDLEPLLRARLDDEWTRIAAARALVRIGTPVGDLTTPLVRGVTDYKGHIGLAAIIELRAVDTIAGLEALLASDTRFEPTSFADDIVWADELLQDRVRSTIGDLRSSEPAR